MVLENFFYKGPDNRPEVLRTICSSVFETNEPGCGPSPTHNTGTGCIWPARSYIVDTFGLIPIGNLLPSAGTSASHEGFLNT